MELQGLLNSQNWLYELGEYTSFLSLVKSIDPAKGTGQWRTRTMVKYSGDKAKELTFTRLNSFFWNCFLLYLWAKGSLEDVYVS